MTDTINETWEQQTFREIAEAETRAEVRASARASRDNLRVLLEERFGSLPGDVIQRIETISDVERLRGAIRQAVHISKLAEFKI